MFCAAIVFCALVYVVSVLRALCCVASDLKFLQNV